MMNLNSLSVPTQERLERAQRQGRECGAEDFKVNLVRGVSSLQRRAEDIADTLEAYLERRGLPRQTLEDSISDEPKSEFYKEARELLQKTERTLQGARNAHRLTIEELLCLTRGSTRDLQHSVLPSLPELLPGCGPEEVLEILLKS